MKKYNTPEMKVSMFNEESITAAEVSNAFATYDAFKENNPNATVLEKSLSEVMTELSISF